MIILTYVELFLKKNKFRKKYLLNILFQYVILLKKLIRRQNSGQKPVKIVVAQVGLILKETDIVRFHDV